MDYGLLLDDQRIERHLPAFLLQGDHFTQDESLWQVRETRHNVGDFGHMAPRRLNTAVMVLIRMTISRDRHWFSR